jgi:hypothetical protein
MYDKRDTVCAEKFWKFIMTRASEVEIVDAGLRRRRHRGATLLVVTERKSVAQILHGQ